MNASELQTYKSKTLPQLLLKATEVFNHYIRLRDTDINGYGRCISCGRMLKVPDKNSQAGHYYAAGHYPSLRYNEDNVHLQCLSDNYFKSGDQIQYRKNLIIKIGPDRLSQLELLSSMDKRRSKIWDRYTLIEIIEKYKTLVSQLKKTKV